MHSLQRLAINNEGFVFDPETGNSYTVNQVGKSIIELLREGVPEDELTEKLLEKFDTTKDSLDRDIPDFLRQLKFFSLNDGSPKDSPHVHAGEGK